MDASPNHLHSATSQYYTSNPTQEDGRLKCHRIEFEVTLRSILPYLPEHPVKVLDIGGGTGPYSFALADKGHDVTLVDFSPGLLSVARARLNAGPRSPGRILEGNALALDALLPGEAGSFDAVLLLGPLYHIMSPELRKSPTRREKRDYVKTEEEKVLHAMNHEHPPNMPAILRGITGQQEVDMVGTEGVLAGGLDRLVNDLQGEAFEAWVRKCLEVGRDEVGWTMSDHIIGIVRKSTKDVV